MLNCYVKHILNDIPPLKKQDFFYTEDSGHCPIHAIFVQKNIEKIDL